MPAKRAAIRIWEAFFDRILAGEVERVEELDEGEAAPPGAEPELRHAAFDPRLDTQRRKAARQRPPQRGESH
jgi:hypothetical protein